MIVMTRGLVSPIRVVVGASFLKPIPRVVSQGFHGHVPTVVAHPCSQALPSGRWLTFRSKTTPPLSGRSVIGSTHSKHKHHPPKSSPLPTFMTAVDDDHDDDHDDDDDDQYDQDDNNHQATTATIDSSSSNNTKTPTSLWNIPVLKKEVTRAVLKCHKKINKLSARLQQEQDDNLPQEFQELQHRLQLLNQLESELQHVKNKDQGVLLPEAIARRVLTLELSDEPAPRPERGAKKQKGPRRQDAFRLPYRRYYSGNVEIRVGKQAEDNDELSLSPQHRDGSDWWMHAAGCPGSHVVIRSHDPNLDQQVIQDAAALAARQSKCTGSIIRVSMTQCRHIVKPPGAKAGLVQLTGPVRTIVVNMKDAKVRLARLDQTVLVN